MFPEAKWFGALLLVLGALIFLFDFHFEHGRVEAGKADDRWSVWIKRVASRFLVLLLLLLTLVVGAWAGWHFYTHPSGTGDSALGLNSMAGLGRQEFANVIRRSGNGGPLRYWLYGLPALCGIAAVGAIFLRMRNKTVNQKHAAKSGSWIGLDKVDLEQALIRIFEETRAADLAGEDYLSSDSESRLLYHWPLLRNLALTGEVKLYGTRPPSWKMVPIPVPALERCTLEFKSFLMANGHIQYSLLRIGDDDLEKAIKRIKSELLIATRSTNMQPRPERLS